MEQNLHLTKRDSALDGIAEPDNAFRILQAEFARTSVVAQDILLQFVASMRSLVALDGEEEEASLVYPDKANWASGKRSILPPVGTAFIRDRVGDAVDWRMPSGCKRIEVKKLLCQPNAVGDCKR